MVKRERIRSNPLAVCCRLAKAKNLGRAERVHHPPYQKKFRFPFADRLAEPWYNPHTHTISQILLPLPYEVLEFEQQHLSAEGFRDGLDCKGWDVD